MTQRPQSREPEALLPPDGLGPLLLLRRAAPPLPDPGLRSALIYISLPLFPSSGQSECRVSRDGGAGRAIGGSAAAAGCRAGGSRCGRGTAARSLNPEPEPRAQPRPQAQEARIQKLLA